MSTRRRSNYTSPDRTNTHPSVRYSPQPDQSPSRANQTRFKANRRAGGDYDFSPKAGLKSDKTNTLAMADENCDESRDPTTMKNHYQIQNYATAEQGKNISTIQTTLDF